MQWVFERSQALSFVNEDYVRDVAENIAFRTRKKLIYDVIPQLFILVRFTKIINTMSLPQEKELG